MSIFTKLLCSKAFPSVVREESKHFYSTLTKLVAKKPHETTVGYHGTDRRHAESIAKRIHDGVHVGDFETARQHALSHPEPTVLELVSPRENVSVGTNPRTGASFLSEQQATQQEVRVASVTPVQRRPGEVPQQVYNDWNISNFE